MLLISITYPRRTSKLLRSNLINEETFRIDKTSEMSLN